jgi:AcrR family transcriptional regulator
LWADRLEWLDGHSRREDVFAQVPGDLRTRKKLDAMRRIQRRALEMFESEGFDRVTVERIAEASEVSPVSVYRYFGSKEQIVIWDEYDPPILDEIQRRLGTRPILDAICGGLIAVADRMLDSDSDLMRIRLVYREPALRAAAERSSRLFAEGLANILRGDPLQLTVFEADIIASSVAGMMVASVDEWQRSPTNAPLGEILEGAFATLRKATGG